MPEHPFMCITHQLQMFWLVLNEPPSVTRYTPLLTPLRVLVAEDSPDDAELLLLELSRGGFDVVAKQVETAEQMRAVLAEGRWDIVVSDHAIPGFGAAEALALCREADPDMPFIVVSGTIGEERAVEIMRAGAGDFFLKGSLARLAPLSSGNCVRLPAGGSGGWRNRTPRGWPRSSNRQKTPSSP